MIIATLRSQWCRVFVSPQAGAVSLSKAGQSPQVSGPVGQRTVSTLQLKPEPKRLGMIRNGLFIRRCKRHIPASADKAGDVVGDLDPGSELAAVLRVGGISRHGLGELKPEKVLA
jgi:hypothetical protein